MILIRRTVARNAQPCVHHRRSFLGMATVIACAAVLALCPAFLTSRVVNGQAGLPPEILALPGHYIANYATTVKECQAQALSSPTWTGWNSYAAGMVGSYWTIASTRPSLCRFAKSTAKIMIDHLPFHDGTSIYKLDWQGYATVVGLGIQDHPIAHNVPKGWKCFALPSWWGASAWSFARLKHVAAPGPDEFEVASGVAAGAGYCEQGGKRGTNRQWSGGSYFSWNPGASEPTYDACFDLKEIPDPKHPGDMIPIAAYADAQVWGDYDRVSC